MKTRAKSGELKMRWGRINGDSPDVCFHWGGGGASSADARFLSWKMEPILEELKSRGYDITTLKFSIQKKP